MKVPDIVISVEGEASVTQFAVCAVRADSAIHWNPTAAGDGRHPTAVITGVTPAMLMQTKKYVE